MTPTAKTPRDSLDADRYDQLVADITRRLRNACSYLDDDEFAALVARIAKVTARFLDIEADPAFWRSVTSNELPLAPLPQKDAKADPP